MYKWILIFLMLPAIAFGQIVQPSVGTGGADADSLKGIPMEDTTGNLADNNIMKYNLANNQWEYVEDATGGGTLDVEEDNASVDATVTNLDFGAGFDLTESPEDEINIVLDLTEKQVNLATEVTGTLPEANGGTGDTDLDNIIGGTGISVSDGANTIIGGNATISHDAHSGDVTGATELTIAAGAVDTSMGNDTEWEEYIEDQVGAMFSGNTETRITVTYNEDGTTDFVVDNMNDDNPDDDSEVPDAITVNPINATTETAIEAAVDLESLQGAVTDGQVPDTLAITLADDQVLKQKLGDEDWGDVSVSSNAVTLDDDVVGAAELKDSESPSDEEIVTYEATGTQFEYHTPGELGLMEDEDVNTFSELQSWVSDKTLMNEEDIFTIDANWINTANPWAVNEVHSDLLTSSEGDAAYQPLEATLTDIADGTIAENLVNTANPWAADEIVSTVIHNDEMDASSELLAIMDDETGTGLLVFGTSPTFTTGITVPDNSISDEELDENASFTWTGTHSFGSNITINGRTETGNKHWTFNIVDPDAVYAIDHEICIDPRTEAALTITRIDVTCDADPTTELDFDLKFADAFIGFANPAVIDELNTTAGVTTITSGFDDATVPANKCIYILFNADPDDDITQVSINVTWDYD